MSELTPSQQQTRDRVEGLIRFIAPTLDVVLSVGDRVSRIVEPEDYDYYPARPLAKQGASSLAEGVDTERPADRSER